MVLVCLAFLGLESLDVFILRRWPTDASSEPPLKNLTGAISWAQDDVSYPDLAASRFFLVLEPAMLRNEVRSRGGRREK